MKYLGIDYGSKRVGLAISDEDGKIAFPRAVVPNDEKLIPFVARMIEEEKVAKVVVGDTRSSSGIENPITKKVEAFAAALKERGGIPVELVSEIFSSVEAGRYSEKSTDHNDASAAAIILQRFLDMQAHRIQ